jgi:2-oxoglutarate dehydrogenase E2 component (dihydrolipoamide succinyltransferase)
MATSVTLPALGESVTEGTVTRWLKQPGDEVAVDEPLLEVSTDKVDTEIPSPVAGTLLEIKVQEDETVEVGAELATIGDEGESGGESAGGGEQAAEQQEQPQASQEQGGEEERKTETETAPPAAQTDGAPPAQETAPASSDTSQEAAASQGGGGGGESSPVTLPALGESVTEGTVTRWLKQVGDDVAVDEPLLEVSTDKVDTEIPSPVAGKLLEIKVQEDETVEVGAELALIGSGQPAPAAGGDGAQNAGAAETPTGEMESGQPEPTGDGAADAGSQGVAQATPPAAQQVEPDAGAEATTERKEQAPAPAQQPAPAQTQQAPAQTQQAPPQRTHEREPQQDGGRGEQDGAPYVTPLVRKMAAEHGVDLADVQGTGVGGRIRKQDVLDAAKAQQAAPAPSAPSAPAAPAAAASQGAPSAPAMPSPLRGKTEKMSRLRKVIATRMVESLQTSAQLTTVVEVDVTAIARLRDSVKEDFAAREGVKLSFLPFFAKAAIDALKEHPKLNAAIDPEKGEITYFDHENLSVAVDTEKGLLTPVVKDAGDLSIAGLARKIADVADRTRANKIGPDELAGGTFTLTNTGSRGALFDTPIINQPQVAILGTGTVVKRPVVIDDPNLGETIAVRQMVYLALTYDHRLVDGADAARFLNAVKQRLEAGQFEV